MCLLRPPGEIIPLLFVTQIMLIKKECMEDEKDRVLVSMQHVLFHCNK